MSITICFLVAAHNKPEMLLKSFQSIYADRHRYLLHIDRKSRWGELAAVTEALCSRPNVSEVPSHTISWGGFSQVDLEFNSVQIALSQGYWDYLVFLSGTDLMVRPLVQLEELLQSADQRSFIDRREIATLPSPLKERIQRRNRWVHVEVRGKPYRLLLPLRWLGVLPKYYGSQWHFLHRSYVEDVVDYINSKGIPPVLRNCAIPDEVFWQNILNDRHGTDERIIPTNYRYAVFHGKPNPKWLTLDDIPEIEASEAYFARKFDIANSGEAVNYYIRMHETAQQ